MQRWAHFFFEKSLKSFKTLLSKIFWTGISTLMGSITLLELNFALYWSEISLFFSEKWASTIKSNLLFTLKSEISLEKMLRVSPVEWFQEIRLFSNWYALQMFCSKYFLHFHLYQFYPLIITCPQTDF